MAVGDIANIVYRLRSVLPSRWFPVSPPTGATATPVLDAVLEGVGWPWFWLYQLLVYANKQSRISTASDQFLDIIGLDFLRSRIVRRPGQSDDRWRARVKTEILRPRATRAALISAVTDLTGRVPGVFEPARTTDTGGYYAPGVGSMGYGVAGHWGSLNLPFQIFVTAYRPHTGGVPNVGGYGVNVGGYGGGSIEWATLTLALDAVTDDDIYNTIANTMATGAIAWTNIQP